MSAAPSVDPLEIAVGYLAGVCDGAVADDGAGFNGVDAAFGHSLAAQTGHWSPKQRAAAHRLTQKYRAQVLAGTGIDVRALAAPEAATPARGILGPGGVLARRFPGYEPREGQLRMADAVAEAIDGRRHLVVEAGTGTGKSYAYLVPAILSGRRTIVSTADKALQDQLVGKDLPALHELLPVPFRHALLKGRSNYVCLHRLDKLQHAVAEPEFRRDQEASAAFDVLCTWAEETESGDLDSLASPLPAAVRSEVTVTSEECLGRKCPFAAACFVERAKAAAAAADIIVVNHALLLRDIALRAMSDGHAHVLPDAAVCVLDEAHNLQRIASDALGLEVTLAHWRRVERRLANLTILHKAVRGGGEWQTDAGAIHAERVAPIGDFLTLAFAAIADRMRAGQTKTQRLGQEPLLAVAAGMLRSVADALLPATPPWLVGPEHIEWEKACRGLRSLGDAIDAIAGPANDELVRYAQIEGSARFERLVLHTKPVDVAPALDAMLWTRRRFEAQREWRDEDGRLRSETVETVAGFETAIATSATLADGAGFGHWRERVGLHEAGELACPSPFDYPTHALLYLPADAAALDPSRGRGEESATYLAALAAEVRALLLASRGRAFVLFTSYRVMDEVFRLVSQTIPWTRLRQGDLPRPELLRKFRADGSAVLFATRSFWEGVDVQGAALSLVIVDKIPFAPPDDPLWDARKEAITRKRRDQWAWFNELAVPDATIALKQGVGRLIRSTADTGVFAILDGRLSTKRYGRDILRALPPAPVTRSLDDVRRFFDA